MVPFAPNLRKFVGYKKINYIYKSKTIKKSIYTEENMFF